MPTIEGADGSVVARFTAVGDGVLGMDPTGEWFQKNVVNKTSIDLSGPGIQCQYHWGRVTPEGRYAYGGIVQCTSDFLIEQAQVWLEFYANNFIASDAGTIELNKTGRYDCATARYMVMIAQAARQRPLGPVDYAPLGALELSFLLNGSGPMQYWYSQADDEAGREHAWHDANNQGINPEYPENTGNFMLLPAGVSFTPAGVPAVCVKPGETVYTPEGNIVRPSDPKLPYYVAATAAGIAVAYAYHRWRS